MNGLGGSAASWGESLCVVALIAVLLPTYYEDWGDSLGGETRRENPNAAPGETWRPQSRRIFEE
ncbi:MAG: hypothetical protein NTW86_27390 [Candidatus Sumerlaeota bacterium]|nr:hypothetical protein [Candidatus Sumerlaeota bacterium]